MRQVRTVSGMRLRLLALVLALALLWYAVNPAPGPVCSVKETKEPPDEERRGTKTPAPAGYGLGLVEECSTHPYEPPASGGEVGSADDLEWPELIDL